jgi:SAM-dependent methyltransferase
MLKGAQPVKQLEIFPGFVITSDDTVADIGCGAGNMCVAAGSIGCAVLAVDTNPNTIRDVSALMRDSPARYFKPAVATSNVIPVANQQANVVICMEVLEHVDDPSQFMTELFRIGRPGARYLLSVPDAISESIMQVVGPKDYFEAPNHVRIISRPEFKNLIEGAGLKITAERFVGFYWSLWWGLRFAAGTDYYPGSPDQPPAVLRKWEETWNLLLASPEGGKAAELLDQAIPKSQVVIAQKLAEQSDVR